MSWNPIRNSASAVLLFAAASFAQITGPVSGVLYDAEDKALRPFVGVPGAGYLGDPIASNLDSASVSPDGRRALAARDGHLLLVDLSSGATTNLGAWEGGFDEAAWSKESDAAAVSGSRAALARSLNATPELALLAAPEGEIHALAVSSHGDAVYAATDGGVFSLGAEAVLVAGIEGASALAIEGSVLYAASASRKEVVAIRGLDGSSEVALLLNESAGVDAVAGLAVSADGSQLYIADAGSRTLSAVSTANGEALLALSLEVAPTRLDRAAGLMVINDRSAAESLEIFDPARGAVFFVPAGIPAVAVEE